jgi:hypothetical protein
MNLKEKIFSMTYKDEQRGVVRYFVQNVNFFNDLKENTVLRGNFQFWPQIQTYQGIIVCSSFLTTSSLCFPSFLST